MKAFFDEMERILPGEKKALVACREIDGTIIRLNNMAKQLLGADTGNNLLTALQKVSEKKIPELLTKLDTYSFLPLLIGGKRYVADSFFDAGDDPAVRYVVILPERSATLQYLYYKYDACLKYAFSAEGQKNRLDAITSVLYAILFLYDADRAYIFEIDPDIECLADIYSCSRTDLSDEVATVRSIGRAGIDWFLASWDSGEILLEENYSKEAYAGTELYEQLYLYKDNWSYIILPLDRELGIRCFIGIDNIRQNLYDTAILRQLTKTIAHQMYIDQLKSHVAASNSLAASLRHMPENRLYVNLFSKFAVSSRYGEQRDFSGTSVQCSLFLVYLLVNRTRNITARELADILWPNELIDNPYNMIKNVAFRARKICDSFYDRQVIIAKNGSYTINPELEIVLDIEEFEKNCRKARNTTLSPETRKAACAKAFELYTGKLLSGYDAEPWFTTRAYYYSLMYNDMLKEYVSLLMLEGDDLTVFDVISRASDIEMVDSEIYLQMIEMLVKNGKRSLAREYYLRIAKTLQTEDDRKARKIISEK